MLHNSVITASSISVSLFEARTDVQKSLEIEIEELEREWKHVRITSSSLQVLSGDKWAVIMAVTVEYGEYR